MVASDCDMRDIGPTKCVSFKDTVRVHKTLHIKDFSRAEIEACWRTRKEEHFAHQRMKMDVVRMECGLELVGDNCPRGLEIRTRVGSKTRRLRSAKVVSLIIDEQENQFNLRETDDQVLAELSMAISCVSMTEAIMHGKMDEQAAREASGLDWTMHEQRNL